jgi:hypothetical protein
VTWEEIKERQDQTKTDPGFNPEFNQIVDLRAVTGFAMTSDHARLLARRTIFFATGKENTRPGKNIPMLRRIDLTKLSFR